MEGIRKLFGKCKNAVVGMIHVHALPGTPRSRYCMSQIIEKACREAEMYKKFNLDGLIVENMHDIPYLHSDSVGPEITASMSVVCSEVKKMFGDSPVGVQILAGANRQALAVAKCAGLQFIRAEGFVFSHIADEGMMNACAGDLLRYRRQIDAKDVQIFTDIKKKHSAHAITSDVDIAETAKAAEFFLSDGVIVTGSATGHKASITELEVVRQAVSIPVLVGSGVTCDNVVQYKSASGWIVGSHFKKDGVWKNELDPKRLEKFMSVTSNF